MEFVAQLCILIGALLMLVASVGAIRFPDGLARMHAAAKAGTLALVLLSIGVVLSLEGLSPLPKLLLVLILQFLTAPVAGHLLGRAAHSAGVEAVLSRDELAEARERDPRLLED